MDAVDFIRSSREAFVKNHIQGLEQAYDSLIDSIKMAENDRFSSMQAENENLRMDNERLRQEVEAEKAANAELSVQFGQSWYAHLAARFNTFRVEKERLETLSQSVEAELKVEKEKNRDLAIDLSHKELRLKDVMEENMELRDRMTIQKETLASEEPSYRDKLFEATGRVKSLEIKLAQAESLLKKDPTYQNQQHHDSKGNKQEKEQEIPAMMKIDEHGLELSKLRIAVEYQERLFGFYRDQKSLLEDKVKTLGTEEVELREDIHILERKYERISNTLRESKKDLRENETHLQEVKDAITASEEDLNEINTIGYQKEVARMMARETRPVSPVSSFIADEED